jgi:putative ABC transport system permease protein
MTGPIPLGTLALVGAAGLLVLNGLLSLTFRLGLEKKLAIAGTRTVVQLLILGYVLVPVFRAGEPLLVVGLSLLMVTVAAFEAVSRSKRHYKGARVRALLAMTVSGVGTAVFATAVLVDVHPWWTPQYLVPLLGMILGNSLTGIGIGLDRCLDELSTGRARVEALLSLGATRWEAARPVAQESLRAGLIPILSSMSAVGLVTIPGMMTGQILSGTPPEQAARYQMLIMFLIAGATALGVGIAVLTTLRALFDDAHRLRSERITER